MDHGRRGTWGGSTLAVLLVALGVAISGAATDGVTVLTGTLGAVWGDPAPEEGNGSRLDWWLFADDGETVLLDLGDELARTLGGPTRLNGRRARVWLDADQREGARRVAALTVLPGGGEAGRDLTGPQPWVSLLCKFSNVSAEPKNLAYFQGMFANVPGRLDHYWRELSYNAINVVGSTAVNWVVLPEQQTHYVPTPGQGCLDGNPDNDADLGALFADCTAAADPYVDFSNGGTGGFVGVNLMFNADLDGCAWGGGWGATLDGVSKVWSVTWEPPWGYENISVMAHEQGHGFGLPHSNNWDDDGWPYDHSWDVMSDSWNYAGWDPTYGTLGKHTIAWHKDLLGWIPANQKLVVAGAGQYTITVDDLALATTANYRMAEIPVASGFDSWTVDVRERSGLYDAELPGDAVIIHQVDQGRDEPAWCYYAAVPPDDESDNEGSMWREGETFEDAANQIQVTVDAATANGFQVTIRSGNWASIFADGFASGTTSAWSQTAP